MKKFYAKFTLFITILLSFTVISVNAEGETIPLSAANVTEYFNAIETIHADSNKSYELTLTGDILITKSEQIKNANTIDNNNTLTIIGNGHTIKCEVYDNCRLSALNGNINLGKENTTNELYLEGAGPTGRAQESLVNVVNGTVKMYDGVVLHNNYSGTGAVSGGGAHIGDNGKFYMYGGVIRNNEVITSSAGGGAIVIDGTNSEFNMINGEISNNNSIQESVGEGLGGAITQLNGTITITGGKIINNTSDYGGAIASYGGTINISNAEISQNVVTTQGGAFFLYEVYGTINFNAQNTVFKANKSTGHAGVMVNYVATNVSFSNCSFEDNEGTNGGVHVVTYGGAITSSNNTYKNNKASRGGAIYSNASFTSSNDVITGNTATSAGGGVYLKSGTANFSTSDVYNNKATGNGNDYYIDSAVSSSSIKAASSMSGYATYGDTNVSLNNWFSDTSSNRYAPDNVTDVVSTLSGGTEYSLTASGNTVYIVKFNKNNGTDMDEQIVAANGKATQPSNPIYDGHDFVGWYADAELNNPYDFDTTISSNNVVIYAKWNTILSSASATITDPTGNAHPDYSPVVPDGANYTVTVDRWYLHEDPYPDLNTDSKFVEGKEYALRVHFVPNAGYVFANDATFTINGQTVSKYGGVGDREYTIVSAAPIIVTHQVTFNLNGGTWTDTGTNVVTVNDGDKVTKPSDPTKDANAFEGWYSDAELNNEFDFDNTTITTDNVTIYAKWRDYSTVAVGTSVGGKWSSSELSADSMTTGMNASISYNGSVTLTAIPDDGYRFVGWYEGVIGSSYFVDGNTTTLISSDATYTTNVADTLVIRAVFEKISTDNSSTNTNTNTNNNPQTGYNISYYYYSLIISIICFVPLMIYLKKNKIFENQ